MGNGHAHRSDTVDSFGHAPIGLKRSWCSYYAHSARSHIPSGQETLGLYLAFVDSHAFTATKEGSFSGVYACVFQER